MYPYVDHRPQLCSNDVENDCHFVYLATEQAVKRPLRLSHLNRSVLRFVRRFGLNESTVGHKFQWTLVYQHRPDASHEGMPPQSSLS
jgi:hypothetical protein